jgi:hypothetical protein
MDATDQSLPTEVAWMRESLRYKEVIIHTPHREKKLL